MDGELSRFNTLRAAQDQKGKAERTLSQAQNNLTSASAELNSLWDTFSADLAQNDIPTDIQKPAGNSLSSDIASIVTFLQQNTNLPSAWDDSAAKRQSQKDSLTNLQKALDTYETNARAQVEIDEILPRLKRTLEIMEEERRKFTDETLSKISIKVGELYEKIHPGEGLNKISLELDPNKRASLGMGASFLGKAGEPPQAYFSDSHLDTLGLCIFLALAQMDDPGNTILVLDDVIASVDEPHVERLINMLYDESSIFQHCIMTTHYRPWKEKFKWGWLAHGQCQLVELTKWSQHSGLAQIRSLSELDRLRQHLAESHPDSQVVAAKAGILLEAALDFLTQLYECSVPRRKDNRYTLGDLLPAIDKKLLAALKIERKDTTAGGTSSYSTHQLQPIIEDLRNTAQVRNVMGCHFNDLAAHLPEADAIAFAQNVLKLMELIVDSDAGWPRNDKSGSYWATAGETRRLHPLRSPR